MAPGFGRGGASRLGVPRDVYPANRGGIATHGLGLRALVPPPCFRSGLPEPPASAGGLSRWTAHLISVADFDVPAILFRLNRQPGVSLRD
jgi:hypothetical protein